MGEEAGLEFRLWRGAATKAMTGVNPTDREQGRIEMKKVLRGIIPPTVTPFKANEDLDEGALRDEVRFMFGAGVHGISFGGSTGEGAVLSDMELARGVEIVQEENKADLPVLCGIIRNSTREAVRAGLAAKAAGADVLMVTPTHYFGATEAGNYEFYKVLAAETGLPIIVYNVVKSNPVSPQAMKKMSEIEGVIGIKQSFGGIHVLTDMIFACKGKTLVFGAQDDLLYVSYLLGADGAISAVLALFPRLLVEQWNAVQEGDLERAKEIHYRVLPVWRKIEGDAFPGKIKAAINLTGRKVGKGRSPILELPEQELRELREEMIRSGFLP